MQEVQKATAPDGGRPGAPVRIGRWRADPRSDEIEADGRVVKLEPLKMRLLLALAGRPGEVLLTQELLDTVWSGLIVSSGSVYQGIAQLRRVLGEEADGIKYIETVPRKGYRLVAPVQRLERGDAAPGTPSGAASATGAPAAAGATATEEASVLSPKTEVEVREGLERATLTTAATPSPTPPAGKPPVAGAPRNLQRRRLLGASAAAAAGFAAWRFFDALPPALPVRIAVLPFTDRSRGGAEPALSQGLAFDVIRALERHPQIDVVASESALAAAGGPPNLADMAARLRVVFLLVGDLVRAGARVQVAVRLLAVPGERLRWTREFEQAMDGASLLPQTIADQAVAALRLAPAPAPPHAAGPTEAYELYVLGEHAWRPKTTEGLVKARDYFERGIEIDPSFAANYIGLGWTWLGQANFGAGVDWHEAFARATPLFDKALRLDPGSAEALTAQGVLRTQAERFDEARSRFEESLKFNPGYAQAHHSYGVAEYDDGWPQRATAHFERAAELNPLSLSPHDRLSVAHLMSGRFEAAERASRRAVALEPQHPNGYFGLGIISYGQGALAAAVGHYREGLQRESRRPHQWDELAWLYLDLGLPERAADAFRQLAALLPKAKSDWPAIDAAYAWVAQPERSPPPAELALTPQQVPEDELAVDVMLLRAMAELPLDEALLTRALNVTHGRSAPLQQKLWYVFQGHNTLLDLAAVYATLGRMDKAQPWLDQAQQQLDRYRQQGNVWHALHFHRARLLALRGDPDAALAELAAAVDMGCRRGWWLRLDPAFAGLRPMLPFMALLARVDRETAAQRALLKI